MLSYSSDNNTHIPSCNFVEGNVEQINPEDIFRVESNWKDRSLLIYSTVQAYAAATGWKPTLSHSIYI